MCEEIWKDVPGTDGKYQVSNLGRARSLDRTYIRKDGKPYTVKGKLLDPPIYNNGYRMIGLRTNKGVIREQLHRAILFAFIGPCPEGMQCRHLDGNPLNNRLDNLCWGTASEDREDQRRLGTMRMGDTSPVAILDSNQVLEIKLLRETGKYKLKDLAIMYNTDLSNISCIVRNVTWKHVGGKVKNINLNKKIDDDGRKRIIALYATGVSARELAKEYNVTTARIYQLVNGKTGNERRADNPLPAGS